MKRKWICLLAVLMVCAGTFLSCGGEQPAADLNEQELLTTKDVVSMLSSEGIVLDTSPDSFDEYVISGAVPESYVWEEGGETLLIYEWDHYPSSIEWKDEFWEYIAVDEKYVVFGDTGLEPKDLQGKNIAFVRLKEPDVSRRSSLKFNGEEFEITDDLKRVLFEKAFGGQQAIYRGENDNWEVIVPTMGYHNSRFVDGQVQNNESFYWEVFLRCKNGELAYTDITGYKFSLCGPETGTFASSFGSADEGDTVELVSKGDYYQIGGGHYNGRLLNPGEYVEVELTSESGSQIIKAE